MDLALHPRLLTEYQAQRGLEFVYKPPAEGRGEVEVVRTPHIGKGSKTLVLGVYIYIHRWRERERERDR